MKRIGFPASLVIGLALLGAQPSGDTVIWRIENPQQVGGRTPTVLGAPRRIEDSGRKALQFNGTADGLIVGQNPLVGRKAFTIEVLFRPDGDGPEQQRFVHIEDAAENRGLIETRIMPGKQWYLDTFLFAKATDTGVTLVDRTKLHPCDRWYWAALVYDGKTMSDYVDAVKEREGTIAFGPMVDGRTSVGVRLNQVYWFKGAIAEVRFHARPLAVAELQKAK